MKLRRIFLTLFWLTSAVALLLGVAVGGGWLALSHGWQRERIRGLVEQVLTSAVAEAGLRGQVHVASVSGPLYPWLVLHGLWLERDGVTVVRIDETRVTVDLSSFYGERRVIVRRAEISGAAVSLAEDGHGAWPWEPDPDRPAPAEAPAERPFTLEVGDVVLSGAELDAVWVQAGAPSHVSARVDGELHRWVLPRAGDPPWPESARASLDVHPGMVAGRALLGAQLAAQLDGSTLRLADSQVDSTFGRVRVSGTTDLAGWLDPHSAANADLSADAEALDLAVLLARPELSGTVGGKLRIEASHVAGTDLADSVARVSLSLAKSRIGKLAIAGGELRGEYERGKWRIERAVAISSAARLTATGSGDLERIAKLDADLEVADLAALAALVSSPARGQANAKLRLTGEWRAPTGTLDLQARGLRVANLELGNLKLAARSTGLDRYRIEPLALDAPKLRVAAEGPVLLRVVGDAVQIDRARLLSERASVSVTGRVSAARVTGLRVELAHLSLARIGELAGLDFALGGNLSGSLRADGALSRPAVSGQLALDAPKLGEVGVGAVTLDVTTSAGVLSGSGRIVAAGQDRLRARFALPWSPRSDPSQALSSPDTRVEIEGTQLELALVREFVPDALERIDGKADVRFALRGGTPEPSLSGELTIANGSCDVPVLAQNFGPLDARLVLDRGALRVDHFVLREGAHGVAEVTGELRLAGLQLADADLALRIDDFPIRWQTTVQAHAFGAVTLRGPPESLMARGEIELRSFRYSMAGGSDPLLGEVRVKDSRLPEKPVRSTPREVTDLWDRATADVRVKIPEDGRVLGQGANLEIAGELVATKKPGGPLAVNGAIDSRHGSYRLRGKTFIVEKAHVAFVGRPDFDPDLDVRAMHRVRDTKVYAVVRGRASNPSVQLSSDPPYPQDDVLALLLFGKTRDELGQQQAGQLQSAIAGTAGAAALDSLSTRLGLDIPIDTLELDDSSSSKSSPTTTVGIGGYVTEDIFVRYGRGLGPDSESNVRVDWRFRRRWSVETSISTRGDSSADLVWTFDY